MRGINMITTETSPLMHHIPSILRRLVIALMINAGLLAPVIANANKYQASINNSLNSPALQPYALLAKTNKKQESETIKLTAKQRKLAEISTLHITEQGFSLAGFVTAKLIVDRDSTIIIAPQVDVLVQARNVVPGQRINQGDVLLTLGGLHVAQAQAEYITAEAEWSRLQQLDENAISQSQRLQVQVTAELKRATLEAINMTPEQIKALAFNPKAIGSYQLLAPVTGKVQKDLVTLGQVVGAGTALMQLTDESHLWAQVELTPAQAEKVKIGHTTLIRAGKRSLEAKIIGRSHALKNATRTEKILVSFDNTGNQLHAGQFAALYLPNTEKIPWCCLTPH